MLALINFNKTIYKKKYKLKKAKLLKNIIDTQKTNEQQILIIY